MRGKILKGRVSLRGMPEVRGGRRWRKPDMREEMLEGRPGEEMLEGRPGKRLLEG